MPENPQLRAQWDALNQQIQQKRAYLRSNRNAMPPSQVQALQQEINEMEVRLRLLSAQLGGQSAF